MSNTMWRTALAVFWLTGVARHANAIEAPAPAQNAAPSGAMTEAEQAQFFTSQVKPILQSNCVSCHSGAQPTGGLRLTSRDALLKGGGSGPAVSLAKPAESLLLAAVNYQGRRMPPSGKLPQAQIDLLTRWVSMGAPWPAGAEASLERPAPRLARAPTRVRPR
jgi:uncharacterized membrane protein